MAVLKGQNMIKVIFLKTGSVGKTMHMMGLPLFQFPWAVPYESEKELLQKMNENITGPGIKMVPKTEHDVIQTKLKKALQRVVKQNMEIGQLYATRIRLEKELEEQKKSDIMISRLDTDDYEMEFKGMGFALVSKNKYEKAQKRIRDLEKQLAEYPTNIMWTQKDIEEYKKENLCSFVNAVLHETDESVLHQFGLDFVPKERFDRSQQELKDQVEENSKVKSMNDELQAENSSLQKKVDALQTERTMAKLDAGSQFLQRKDWQRECEALKDEVSRLKDESVSEKDRLELSRKEIFALNKELREEKHLKSVYRKDYNNTCELANAQGVTIKELKQKHDKFQNDVLMLVKERDELREDFNYIRSTDAVLDFRSEIEKLKRRVECKNTIITSQVDTIGLLDNRIAVLDSQIEGYEKENGLVVGEIKMWKESFGKQQEYIEKLEDDMEKVDAQLHHIIQQSITQPPSQEDESSESGTRYFFKCGKPIDRKCESFDPLRGKAGYGCAASATFNKHCQWGDDGVAGRSIDELTAKS